MLEPLNLFTFTLHGKIGGIVMKDVRRFEPLPGNNDSAGCILHLRSNEQLAIEEPIDVAMDRYKALLAEWVELIYGPFEAQ